MSAREGILETIRRNRPPAVDLPSKPSFASSSVSAAERVAAFTATLEAIGGRVVTAAAPDVGRRLTEAYPEASVVASAVPELLPGTFDLQAVSDPHALADVDLYVCRGRLGVAENGAVWLAEADLVHRAAPFLTQHLALVLDREALVATMHEAYDRIHVDGDAFGVFVAGPSKTADIEQSLVIGAHGARSVTVCLVDTPSGGPADPA